MTRRSADLLSPPVPTQRKIDEAFYRGEYRQAQGLFICCGTASLGIILSMVGQAFTRLERFGPGDALALASYGLLAFAFIVLASTFRASAPYRPVSRDVHQALAAQCAAFPSLSVYVAAVESQDRLFVRCEAAVLRKVLVNELSSGKSTAADC